MNILVITDKLYPDEHGGSCVVAYETINEWQKDNNVDIFTCKKTKTSNDKLFKGNVYRNLSKKNVLKSAKSLSKIIKNSNYDIILYHSVISWFIYSIARKFYKDNCRKVAIFHGPWHKEAIYKYQGKDQKIKEKILPKIMLILEKQYVNENQNFIFLSEYMKKELTEINKKTMGKNTFIIPGGINIEKYNRNYSKIDAKKKLNIDNEKKVIFTLRRLDKRMGIDDAIKAIGMIEDKQNYEFVVGGKGNYSDTLEKMAKKENVNVKFAGFIPDDEVNLYFCAADLFLVPSKDLEGFGLVNLESLAMGVPVLARPQGGMIELEDKFENFYLCESMEIDKMKEKIIELSDKFKNKVITENNIYKYSWEKISKEYIKIFKELLKDEDAQN